MFLILPLRVDESNGSERAPWANSLLIVVNVLVFFLTANLGWNLAVGRGTSLATILTYGFAHADPLHLIGNMWFLWLFGNPVNRRLGNRYYLLSYLGTILALGMFAWLFAPGLLLGSSGGIFAVMFLFMMLMPRAGVQVGYVALFPFSLLVGLFSRPKTGSSGSCAGTPMSSAPGSPSSCWRCWKSGASGRGCGRATGTGPTSATFSVCCAAWSSFSFCPPKSP